MCVRASLKYFAEDSLQQSAFGKQPPFLSLIRIHLQNSKEEEALLFVSEKQTFLEHRALPLLIREGCEGQTQITLTGSTTETSR